jgi:ABC-2 type transport system permease protein
MIPTVKWTLRARRTSTIWWSIGLVALIVITLAFYPAFKDQGAQLQVSFSKLPSAALELLGGDTDFFSPLGYLNGKLYFVTLPVTLAILSIGLGSSLIAKEEEQKTIEHLLSRPLSRSRLLYGKALAGGLIFLIVNLASTAATLTCAKAINLGVPLGRLVAVSVICMLLTAAFGSLALMLTAIGKVRGATTGIVTAYALGGYLIDSLAHTVHWLDVPSKLFLFHYYQSDAVLRGTNNWWFAGLFVAVIALSLLIARQAFASRDLQ